MDRSVLGDGCPCPRDVMDAPALGTRLCKELDAAGEGMGQGGLHLARAFWIHLNTNGVAPVRSAPILVGNPLYKWQAAKPARGNVAKLPLRAAVPK